MTPDELGRAIIAATRVAVARGELTVTVPSSAPVRYAGTVWASPLPLRLASEAGRPAAEVAALIRKRLAATPGIARAEVAGGGFLSLIPRNPGDIARQIVDGRALWEATPDRRMAAQPAWQRRPLTFANPGFVVRFAHVRATATLRWARDLGLRLPDTPDSAINGADAADGGHELLAHPAERDLLGLLGDFPRPAGTAGVAAGAAGGTRRSGTADDGRRLARRLDRIAEAYHDVHEQCPALPQGDEPPTAKHEARLLLAEAAGLVLRRGLMMLGEKAPERM